MGVVGLLRLAYASSNCFLCSHAGSKCSHVFPGGGFLGCSADVPHGSLLCSTGSAERSALHCEQVVPPALPPGCSSPAPLLFSLLPAVRPVFPRAVPALRPCCWGFRAVPLSLAPQTFLIAKYFFDFSLGLCRDVSGTDEKIVLEVREPPDRQNSACGPGVLAC